MRTFLDYFLTYWRRIPRVAIILTVLLVTILVAINYTVGIERRIQGLGKWYWVFAGQAFFFGAVVAMVWALQIQWGGARMTKGLLRLLAAAVLLFSAKMVHWDLSSWLPGDPGSLLNRYWVIVTQLPAKLLLFLFALWALRKVRWIDEIGLNTKGFHAGPYLGLLLLLVPLVVLASRQPDFLRVYPKVRTIDFMSNYPGPLWRWRAGYELAYGLDFLSIELFFRGLLVIGLIQYAGEKAILPMAAFYCTIHFGKPLAECITSFAGGLVLGVLAYRTRSVLGGLLAHLGLAWMMEGIPFFFTFIHLPF
jgi:Type II CAAX prenyl endopeptidase Rce1-like